MSTVAKPSTGPNQRLPRLSSEAAASTALCSTTRVRIAPSGVVGDGVTTDLTVNPGRSFASNSSRSSAAAVTGRILAMRLA